MTIQNGAKEQLKGEQPPRSRKETHPMQQVPSGLTFPKISVKAIGPKILLVPIQTIKRLNQNLELQELNNSMECEIFSVKYDLRTFIAAWSCFPD
jgi:hypothetical protein